ncbi:MAG: hypothetical protein IRZ16_14045 [Myxococcaceae bacterium]|nr:hypothetical protein [Myxococcaceae bacterium]
MNGGCQRFEAEGLERLVRGEALGDHFVQCADCAVATAEYERLTTALRQMPRYQPPANFEAKVWAQIARKERRRRALFAFPAVAVAAAAAITVMVWPRTTATPTLSLQVQDVQTEAVRGTGMPKPGDVLIVRAGMPKAIYAELRVYRDGALVMRCSGGPTCTRTGDVVEAKVPLEAIGHYEAVLFYGKDPLPPLPDGRSIADDLDCAINAGAALITAAPVDVH